MRNFFLLFFVFEKVLICGRIVISVGLLTSFASNCNCQLGEELHSTVTAWHLDPSGRVEKGIKIQLKRANTFTFDRIFAKATSNLFSTISKCWTTPVSI